jgi:hypothetical protein
VTIIAYRNIEETSLKWAFVSFRRQKVNINGSKDEEEGK